MGQGMKYVLDYETHYIPKVHDIKTMGLIPYVRHPDTGVTSYATAPQKNIDLTIPASLIIAHNATFDALIHAQAGFPPPLQWACTASMSRLLQAVDPVYCPPGHSLRELSAYLGLGVKGDTELAIATGGEALRAYNQQDADLTAQLYDTLINWLKSALPRGRLAKELAAIHLTVAMASEPQLILDPAPLIEFIEAEEDRRAGIEDVYRSPAKFAELLSKMGVTLPQTAKGSPSVADSVLDDVLAQHPDLEPHISQRRLVSSPGELAKAKKFLDIAVGYPDANGQRTLPVLLKYAGAHTLRWSGDGGLNVQAMTRGGPVRRALVAPPGHKIVAADLKQIEARCLLAYAGQDDMLQDMVEGRDAYRIMAGLIYSKPPDAVTPDERFIGKATVLGCGYGMGAAGAQRQITKDPALAQKLVAAYRQRATKVVELWRELDKVLYSSIGGPMFVKVPFSDRHMIWRDIRCTEDEYTGYKQYTYVADDGVTKGIYGGKVTENIIQASARDLLLDAVLLITNELDIVPSALVHDEIVYVIEDDYVDTVMDSVMNDPALKPQPWMAWEVKSGESYWECK
jgi:hypothetical protein